MFNARLYCVACALYTNAPSPRESFTPLKKTLRVEKDYLWFEKTIYGLQKTIYGFDLVSAE